MTERMFFGIAFVIYTAVLIYLSVKQRNIEWDVDAALNAAANTAKAVVETQSKIENFQERFDAVIAEAERQNEREAKWNDGLNNILNYCLEDSFKAGGVK
jgi:F0F1-type ATP synthase membrane subunit b/b'